MTVSIIIVSWNALPLLQRCLPSVIATEYPKHEIILADNASDDGSTEWVSETFPGVRIVRHPENWAFAKGNNRAVAHARGDVLLFLNNDVIVPPDWLSPIVSAFQRDPQLVAAQPKLLQPDVHPPRFEYAGAAGGHLDRYGFPFTRGRIFADLEEDRGQYDDEADIFWATGAAMAVRREAFEQEGGFDEAFVMHMEEIDLCWRMRRHGGSIRVIPESTVFHIGGASLPRDNPRKTYLNFRNSLLMLRKNLPDDEWKEVRIKRYVLDRIAMLRAVLSGKIAEARAIRQAHRDAERMYGAYAGPPEGALVRPSYEGSIVVDYFLRQRRSFCDLPQSQFSMGGSVR
jgi:GT2 family glycosyltransferase